MDTTMRHLQAMTTHANVQSNSQTDDPQSNDSQSNADLQSKLGLRGVSNILYAMGSMGCLWSPTEVITRARARASGSVVATSGSGRDESNGVPLLMQTAVIDALVTALSTTTMVVVTLEDLGHLLHALAHIGFDFQVSDSIHTPPPHTPASTHPLDRLNQDNLYQYYQCWPY